MFNISEIYFKYGSFFSEKNDYTLTMLISTANRGMKRASQILLFFLFSSFFVFQLFIKDYSLNFIYKEVL